GVKTEEVGLIGCFNDKAVGQFNHRLAPRFSGSLLLSGRPGRFRWALPSIHDSRAEAKESHEITRGSSGVPGSRWVGTGRRSENRDPLPGTLSTSMVPP